MTGEGKRGRTAQEVLFAQLFEAKSFYKGKEASYKRRLFRWKLAAQIPFWTGGGLLGLSAYGLLLPLMASAGFDDPACRLHLLYAQPQALPTVLVALGGAIGVLARKRGYLTAWVRTSRTLSQVSMLAARAEAAVASARTEEDSGRLTRESLEELHAMIAKEREDWARDLQRDIDTVIPGGAEKPGNK